MPDKYKGIDRAELDIKADYLRDSFGKKMVQFQRDLQYLNDEMYDLYAIVEGV